MTKIPRLTKESEGQISSALSKVAALTNAGESPNDAIVKVASARKIPAGHVRLMVRAFNNGRSLSHIRENDGLAEKAAAFSLADASEILERMYPSEVKTPAQKTAASAVADDYGMSPAGWLKRRAQSSQHAALTKTAAARDEEAAAPPYPGSPRRQGQKAVSAMHDMRREHTMVKDAAIAAGYKVAETVNAVGDYFRQPSRRPVAEVTANAKAAWGPPGAKLVKHAADMVMGSSPCDWTPSTHAFSVDDEPYSLIKAALDAMTDFSIKRTALDTLESDLPEKRAEVLRPFALGPETDVITGSVWDNQSQTKQAAGMLGLGIAGFMGGSARGLAEKAAPKTREDLVQDKLQDLGAPEHEDKLRGIRMQTMIHEMMVGDPVISGYDPQDVMEAYNHLAQVAPRAMQQRVMAQALIRKYLEQASAIDPFDVDQMLDVESKLTDRDMPKQLMATTSPGPTRELGPPTSQPRPAASPSAASGNIVDSALNPKSATI